jgi:hypothetical protein
MKMTLGKYKITYDCGTTQEKDLIDHDDYLNIIKPKEKRIYELSCVPKDDPGKEEANREMNALKKEVFELVGDSWFTNQSPLFEASKTGILSLPETQGGNKKCSVIQIN